MKRQQEEQIFKDLHRKMVFLTGPRQAGKTTLAKQLAKRFSSSLYLTYDRKEDREIIEKEAWLPTVELIIFDELHKMVDWKNYLKGVYDTKAEHQKILVTGSARLEIFNRVGDSLAGRYFLHRLLPLSPAECNNVHFSTTLDHFLERGGFPEPFLAEELSDATRWRLQYTDSMLNTDVLNFENIHNLKNMRQVFDLLRERVCSPVSYSSIAEDIAISPTTVKKYIQILEDLYIVFRITPFSNNIARSLLKEPKIYFFDGGLVKGANGAKFENLVAFSLFKNTLGKVDCSGIESKLYYLQTKEKQEVNFAIATGDNIDLIIEAKHRDRTISPALRYFQNKYSFPAIQLVKELKNERRDGEIEIRSAETYLKSLSF